MTHIMSHIVSKVCYCGKDHSTEKLGWTVVRCNDSRSRSGFLVYQSDSPQDATHHAADLAPFTHSSKAKAVAAGKAGHMAYLPMHHIYIGSGRNHDVHIKCREALEKRYPHLTFDTDILHGVSGVRFHTTKYDLDSPLMIELRQFCDDFFSVG